MTISIDYVKTEGPQWLKQMSTARQLSSVLREVSAKGFYLLLYALAIRSF